MWLPLAWLVALPVLPAALRQEPATSLQPPRADPRVAQALTRAALWLCDEQRPDGSWSGDVEDTSVALMALLACGHGPDQGSFKFATERALQWLQRSDLEWVRVQERALVTLALAETYEVAPSQALRSTLERLTRRWTGPWSEPEGDRADAAWRILALRAVEDLGFAIDSRAIVRNLDRLGQAEAEPSALELAARVACGQTGASHARIDAAIGALEALRGHLATVSDEVVLYGSVALRELDGGSWEDWNGALQGALLADQEADGSWIGDEDSNRQRRTARLTLALGLDPTRPATASGPITDGLRRAPRNLPPDAAVDPGARALGNGLAWLARHQEPDGRWDCDRFMERDPAQDRCSGPGDRLHDVGVTGLALLAFLGDGSSIGRGRYADVVTRGVDWLRGQQDPETGLIGERIGHAFHYDHAIASLVVCEAYIGSRSPLLRATAQRAVDYVLRARNPYGAWRYDSPPSGDNDTSVTGWMVLALKAAEEAGLEVDREAFDGALAWIVQVTDPGTGRVGYDAPGSRSSRIAGVNEDFPPEKGEAMTAAGLLCSVFLGQDPRSTPILSKHADLLLRTLPKWEADGSDMYYWYYGTYAMYQMGGRHWERWSRALADVALENQRQDGAHEGSWDPAGPWGRPGGRVYSTAMMVLCLEGGYRYARVLGPR